MVTTRPKGKYTYADYAAKPDDEHWELIDGVLYQTAAGASARHQDASENLGSWMDRFVRPRRLGRLYRPRFDLILPGETAVEPDLLFVRSDRLHIITDLACEGTPDLVVEILSPSNPRHDLERKRELYARHGIPEYLILDPYQVIVRALTQPVAPGGEGEYTRETVYDSADSVPINAMPGLIIAVAEIFA